MERAYRLVKRCLHKKGLVKRCLHKTSTSMLDTLPNTPLSASGRQRQPSGHVKPLLSRLASQLRYQKGGSLTWPTST